MKELLDCGHAPDEGMPEAVDGKTIQGWTFVLRDGKKICHACDNKRVLSCGHNPSPHSLCSTGTAHFEGEEICWECADEIRKKELLERKPFFGYVSCDGKHITSWSGGTLMKIVESRPCKLTRSSFLHDRATYQSIHAVDCHGAHWYGRGSAGVAIKLRPCK